MNNFERIDWICQKCGQANYRYYMDNVSMNEQMKIEKLGMDSRNTCINCRYQRNPETRIPDVGEKQ